MHLNQLRKTLVLDIETASIVDSFEKMDKRHQSFWRKKSKRFSNLHDYPLSDEELSALYVDKAAIFAEFAKVICISVGYFGIKDNSIDIFKIKSFHSDNEVAILTEFAELLNAHYFDKYHHTLAGHNIKEFDIPFLCRRMIINQIPLPNLMRISGTRPWQTPHLMDTIQLWKFGDYKNYSSLDLLCSVLDVASPKDKMDGSEVNKAYWDGRLEEIKDYCEKDLVATARVLLRLTTKFILEDEQVEFV